MLNELELTGRACTHVVQRDDLGAALHREALEAFLAMKRAAEADGVEIRVVSSFRDFAAQQRIWDGKYLGERPLYDAHGNTRDHERLDPDELIDAIVCWSAVPGGSRHHWGTDVDVIDSAAIPEGYRVRLLPDDDEATLAARVLRQEHRIYPLAARWCIDGRLLIEGDAVRVRDAAAQLVIGDI